MNGGRWIAVLGTVGMLLVVGVRAGDQEASISAIRVVAVKKAIQMPTDWNGSVVYVSVGAEGRDPSSELLGSLADGVHVFKAASACPRRRLGNLGPYCYPEEGAIAAWVGEVSFLRDDLAEARVGYSRGPTASLNCPFRFRRKGIVWSLVLPEEFAGLCRVS